MALITGTDDGEALYGTAGDDQIDARGGNDYLAGGDGADVANGGAGDDVINITDTLDTVDGGSGSNLLQMDFSGSSVGVTMNLTALWTGGTGTLSSSLGSGTIVNMSGFVSGFNTFMYGSNFADSINIGDMTTPVYGLAGNDVLTGGTQGDALFGGGDNDALNGNGGNDYLAGGDGADVANGGAGDDVINITDTLDTVDGGSGSNLLQMDFSGSSAGVTMDLTALWTGGTGTLSSSLGSGTIVNMSGFASGFNIFINGSNLADNLSIGDMTTPVHGFFGNDIIVGGVQADALYGEGDNDSLNGNDGNDYLVGGDGIDIANGGAGDDTIFITDTRDTVDGGSGNNLLQVDFSGSSAGVTMNLANLWTGGLGKTSSSLGSGTIRNMTGISGNAVGSSLDDILTIGNAAAGVYGRAGNDVLTGGTQADALYGEDGNDVLHGRVGNDILAGGNGMDIANGGDGNDEIIVNDTLDRAHGGNGTDTLELDFTASTVGVTINLARLWTGGTGKMSSSLGSGSFTGMEALAANVNGSSHDDTLRLGDIATSNVHALDGNDTVLGGSLDDHFFGDIGNDNLSGRSGNDSIAGGEGDDTIVGGIGADVLNGGSGNDTFVYGKAEDSITGLFDTITDFDAIADHFDFRFGVTAVETAIVTGALSAGSMAADLQAAVNLLGNHHAVLFTADAGGLSGHTYMMVDVNGAAGFQAGADFIVELQGAVNLDSLGTGDFV